MRRTRLEMAVVFTDRGNVDRNADMAVFEDNERMSELREFIGNAGQGVGPTDFVVNNTTTLHVHHNGITERFRAMDQLIRILVEESRVELAFEQLDRSTLPTVILDVFDLDNITTGDAWVIIFLYFICLFEVIGYVVCMKKKFDDFPRWLKIYRGILLFEGFLIAFGFHKITYFWTIGLYKKYCGKEQAMWVHEKTLRIFPGSSHTYKSTRILLFFLYGRFIWFIIWIFLLLGYPQMIFFNIIAPFIHTAYNYLIPSINYFLHPVQPIIDSFFSSRCITTDSVVGFLVYISVLHFIVNEALKGFL